MAKARILRVSTDALRNDAVQLRGYTDSLRANIHDARRSLQRLPEVWSGAGYHEVETMGRENLEVLSQHVILLEEQIDNLERAIQRYEQIDDSVKQLVSTMKTAGKAEPTPHKKK